MNYPLISEYIEAIKSAEDNFVELTYLRPVLDEEGLPIMSVGNFAVVFKMIDQRNSKLYAVKCFTKEQEGRAESYRLIADELEFVSSNYLTSIRFLESELFVDTNQSENEEFPILLMDWVEGIPLDMYIKKHSEEKFILEKLAFQFCQMASWLLSQPFAHGDLKPDNILVREDGTLVLVDYDGMYVPAMKGQNAKEIGSLGFRHPIRSEKFFDESIDDFSIFLIAMSLKAYSLKKKLVEKYCYADMFLFNEKDFLCLNKSDVMPYVLDLLSDSEFCSLYGAFLITLANRGTSLVSQKLLSISNPKNHMSYGVYLYRKGRKQCEAENNKNVDYKKAFSLFSKSAQIGYPEALCCLGCCYKNGYGTNTDYSKALEWFELSSQKKCGRAFRHIAMCYEQGKGVEKDIERAIDNYEQAANLRDFYSFVCIGKAYESGINIEKDLKKAFEYYLKAAKNGNAEGQRRVGLCYHVGQGIERNYKEGIRWLELSANQNDDLAQKLLGYCYYSGDGVKQDYIKSMYWYKLSAENGNEVSQYRLGMAYLDGTGVEKSSSKAFFWIEKAAMAEYGEAQDLLGLCYYNGIGTNIDFPKAAALYLRAAENNNADGMWHLANCYKFGKGLEKDLKKAAELFKKAADLGHERAKEAYEQINNNPYEIYSDGCTYVNNKEFKRAYEVFSSISSDSYGQNGLGFCFAQGLFVEQNIEKAAYWFQKAARKGLAIAQYNLALCYYLGKGIRTDKELGSYWKRKAIEQGLNAAKIIESWERTPFYKSLGIESFNFESTLKSKPFLLKDDVL